MQENRKHVHAGCEQRAAYSASIVSGPLSPVVLYYLWDLDYVKVWRSKKIIRVEQNAIKCLEQPLVAPFCRTLSNVEGTVSHPLLLLDLLLVPEVIYLCCWRVWNFFSCSSCIQFQSKLNHLSCIKCMLNLMASWAEEHDHCFMRLHVFIQFSLENQGNNWKANKQKTASK